MTTATGAQRMDWNDVWKTMFGATAVALIGSLIAYFRSIGGKADKQKVEEAFKEFRADWEKQLTLFRAEVYAQLEETKRRHSAWESKSERYATREMVSELKAELKSDFQRLENRLEVSFQKQNEYLVKLLEHNR